MLAKKEVCCTPQGYLWTLKCCHGGADMDTAAEMAKGNLDGDTVYKLFDMLANRWGRRTLSTKCNSGLATYPCSCY
jgi:hypothetical protein